MYYSYIAVVLLMEVYIQHKDILSFGLRGGGFEVFKDPTFETLTIPLLCPMPSHHFQRLLVFIRSRFKKKVSFSCSSVRAC